MNEFSALMTLLTRTDGTMRGISEAELLKMLHLPEKLGKGDLQKKLTLLDNYVQPLGLQVRVNPLNNYWFIAFRQEITDFTNQTPFKGKARLSATLLATIIAMLKYGNHVPISAVQEIRKKETVRDDIKQLQRLGYVDVVDELVVLTPLIGYHLDLVNLFEAISEQLVKQPKTESL